MLRVVSARFAGLRVATPARGPGVASTRSYAFGFGRWGEKEAAQSGSANLPTSASIEESEITRMGAKSKLKSLLKQAGQPLTGAELWALAEPEGLKSKRFMKQMLSQMRKDGSLFAKPLGGGKRHKSYSYVLKEDFAAARQAKLDAERAAEARKLQI